MFQGISLYLSLNYKDEEIIRMIIKNADDIISGIEEYDITFDKFKDKRFLKNSISMSIMQIGEHTKKLSKEFRKKHSHIPWVLIGDMRNRFAHAYDVMNEEMIWDVAIEYVPELKKECIKIPEEVQDGQ